MLVTRLSLLNKFVLFSLIALLFLSCSKQDNKADLTVKNQLQTADSLDIAGNSDSANKVLLKLRPQINIADPLICTYYSMRAQYYATKADTMNLYADSALAFFSDNSKVEKNPGEYFTALLTKGDVSLKTKKFITALNYYYLAKSTLLHSNYDDGDLANKLGALYYEQRNFMLAAKYWNESYYRLSNCNKKLSPQKLFAIKQGLLNNTGFAYQRANQSDSANHYYQLDLDLINHADSANVVSKLNIKIALLVVYDNLGGVNLMKGNLPLALNYLTKCLTIPVKTNDGIRIPPLLKLANLYMQMGDNKKAALAFNQCRALLNLYYRDNMESDITWNKLYAEYLIRLHQPVDAYGYQENYIKLRDSVNNSMADLYRLNVDREFTALKQHEVMQELMQQNRFRQLYIAGIFIIVILFIVILVLIYRNLIKSQKNHKDTTLHNQQLQQTLSELEYVNKNYIRIMRVMAHDLKNPLSGMTGMVSMLLDESEFSEENKYLLKLIQTTGTNSMVMINDLLKSGLADENEQLVTNNLDINSLLYDSVELLQFGAKDKQQQIIFEHDPVPVMASVNHEKIWRVFNNLISNAIKFSYNGGIIKVGIKVKLEHIIISVADNGIGIPPAQKETIFEMFTSAKRVGTNGEQPFGLGLSISKRIVEMHNGRIWFEDNTGGGTIFYIELPYSG
jgi:signal transduction histidine kinase